MYCIYHPKRSKKDHQPAAQGIGRDQKKKAVDAVQNTPMAG
jgi:hypothetical protein